MERGGGASSAAEADDHELSLTVGRRTIEHSGEGGERGGSRPLVRYAEHSSNQGPRDSIPSLPFSVCCFMGQESYVFVSR